MFRDAEDLFTRLPVDHVWLVYTNTKSKVQGKQAEVRDLISDRYHDLIDSADAIVGMELAVSEFKSLATHVEKMTRELIDVDSDDEPQPQQILEHDFMTQVDLLTHAAVDIWESIDGKNLWLACQLFMDSEKCYNNLDSRVFERYPYLRSHWTLVKEARDKIIQESKAVVSARGMEAVEGSIKALVSLGHLTAMECVELRLSSRTETIQNILKDESLVAAMCVLRQTIVDVGSLASVYHLDVVDIIKAWIPADMVYEHALKTLQDISDIDVLSQLENSILKLEGEDYLDKTTWMESYEVCLGSKEDDLFEMVFKDSFKKREIELLLKTFQLRCADFIQYLDSFSASDDPLSACVQLEESLCEFNQKDIIGLQPEFQTVIDWFKNQSKEKMYIANICESIQKSESLGTIFGDSFLHNCFAPITHRIYLDWIEKSLDLSKSELTESLRLENWDIVRDWRKLYCGWEKVSLEDNDDIVILPGALSAGVASFCFVLLKQTRLVKNREAVNGLCTAAYSFVIKTYSAHIDMHQHDTNEAAAMQTIFDMRWLEWLLNSKVDNESIVLIEKVIEYHIDPVDWMVYEPHMESRINRHCNQSVLLFGPLLLSSTRKRSISPDSSVSNMGNLLYLGSKTLPRIPLLPISMSWKKPSSPTEIHSPVTKKEHGGFLSSWLG